LFQEIKKMKNILGNSNFGFTNWCVALIAPLFVLSGIAQAQVNFSNATYTFSTNGNVASFAYNGSPVDNLTIGNIVKSSGITTSSSSGNFRGTGWTTTSSLDATDHIGFSLTAASGYTLSLTTFNFGVGRSATGTRSWAWYYSTNGFTNSAILTNYTTLAA